MRRAVLAAGLAAAVAAPATAHAAALPPSLALDTSYAFSGFNEFDFRIGAVAADDAAAAATDPSLGRLYAAGTTAGADGLDVALVARRGDGSLDTRFAGTGSLDVALSTGDDRGTDVAVLPDGRLRVLVTTTTAATPPAMPEQRVAVLGLLADGTRDPAFGTDGVVRFDPAAAGLAVTTTRMAAAADGRIAITGASGTGAAQQTFVAVRNADGSADTTFGAAGRLLVDRAAGAPETGAAVAWTPRGLAVLIGLGDADDPAGAVLRALLPTGMPDTSFSEDGDLELTPGGARTTAGGLEQAADALWVTGATTADGDQDAYLAKVSPAGGAELRRFDMRGATFPASERVDTAGLDLTRVPGDPETLVVGGATSTDAGTEPSAAAFNELTRAPGALQSTDLVVPVEGQGSVVGVAGGPDGEVAVTAALLDFSRQTGSGTNDTGIGMGRLVVDREKRCDLSMTVAAPLELRLAGRTTTPASLRVVNVGQRACAGTVTVAPPFATTPAPLETGRLDPGQAVTLSPAVGYLAPVLPETAQATFDLAAPGDVAPGDNRATLNARFAFCDVGLRTFRAPRWLPLEGRTALTLSVRNRGTVDCRTTGAVPGVPGVLIGTAGRYSVPAGKSVTDPIELRAARAVKPGTRTRISLRVGAATDVSPADNATTWTAVAVRPGDTDVRVPRDGRTLEGRARAGRAPGQKARLLRVRRVQVAVRQVGKRCRWLTGARVRFAAGDRGCKTPRWITAKGTSRFTLKLRRRLPAGRYVVLTRAVLRNGVVEARWSSSDRNERRFRVRPRT